MKAKNKAYLLVLVCVIVFTGLGISCSKDDKSAGNVELLSFGPSPIPRGGELRIIGKNLDQVQSVVLPGCGAVTDINRISATEIRIIIPPTADDGQIVLKGGSTDVTSITDLVIDVTKQITSVTPLNVKAGDVITIKGDYLDSIAGVVFPNDIIVFKFESQSRQEVKVKVPLQAQSGKIAVIYDPDITKTPPTYKMLYAKDELVVTLPAITAISPNPIKAGQLLTITGTNFDLVDSLAFGGSVGTRTFASHTATQITLNVPANAREDYVKAIAFSGVGVNSHDSLHLVVPVITSISPNPVKNGAVLTVTGTDLDLISKVTFGGSKDSTIVAGGTATQIQVNVPIGAISGPVVFTTQANKTVSSATLNFVQPVITNIAPTSIFAGDQITITGTDFDLVTKVTLGNNTTGTIVSKSATSMVVQSLPNTTTGIVSLTTTNGTVVNSTQTVTVNSILPVITSITPQVKPGGLLSITGTKLNLVESITFQDGIKATKYGTRSETLIEVYVPDNAKTGNVTVTMTTFDGKNVVSPVFVVAGVDPIVDPTLVLYNFDDLDGTSLTWTVGAGLGEKHTLDGPSGNFYEVTAAHPSTGGWQWLFAENYKTHPSVSGLANYVLKIDVRLRNDLATPAGSWGLQLQFNIGGKVCNIESYLKVGSVLSTGGEWKTISIPLTSFSSLPDPTPASGGNWGLNSNQGSPINNLVGLCIDNVRYEKVN